MAAAEEVLEEITLRTYFYRDGFALLLTMLGAAFTFIVILSVIAGYLFFHKPPPILFSVGNEWRVLSPVPVEQPYLNTADLLQWVTNVLTKIFDFDFVHYDIELSQASQYFTSAGWNVFLNQINNYADYQTIQNTKLFVTATPTGAPFILNQGILQGRYAWWVQVPITLNYNNGIKVISKSITLQIFVVRIPTQNNLSGVGIDNILVVTGS